MSLSVDFETRSPVDLRATGVYPYAAHPDTDVWCMAWALDDREPGLWVPGMPVPAALSAHVQGGGEIRAWNAQFERIIWWMILSRRYGFPAASREQFVCTAAEAAAMALPRSLEQAAKVLGLPVEKDMEGHRLMMRMAKPRKPRKGEPAGGLLWWDDDERKQKLYDYCKQDVAVERAVAAHLRPLGAYERRVYLLDQTMNDRGVLVDRPLVEASTRIVQIGMERANEEIDQLTSGAVESVTKVASLTSWLQDSGVALLDVRKDTLRDLLADGDDLPDDVRRVIELRSESAKSSTAKLASMLKVMCADDRARGLLLYHGASTGRWSGKLIQPQNFPRGSIKDVERFIPAILALDYDQIDAEAPPLVVISSLLRGMLRAADGHSFMAGDFSQIEARVLAWIAEQDDLVHLFATGGKVYEEMAAYIYGLPVEEIGKDSVQRQIGKNTILGAGFQMGWSTFQAQVKVQTGIDISDADAMRAIDGYRAKNSNIKKFWYSIERAATKAVENPGRTVTVGREGKIKYAVRGQFLWCVLPSGRMLAYGKPEIRMRPVPWDPDEKRPQLTAMGVSSFTRQWTRYGLYGGLLTENVVQAMARDLIAGAMVRLEENGYRPLLSVHDEVLGEVPDGHGSLGHFLQLMETRPRWAAGLPVAVDGWQGMRYRK